MTAREHQKTFTNSPNVRCQQRSCLLPPKPGTAGGKLYEAPPQRHGGSMPRSKHSRSHVGDGALQVFDPQWLPGDHRMQWHAHYSRLFAAVGIERIEWSSTERTYCSPV